MRTIIAFILVIAATIAGLVWYSHDLASNVKAEGERRISQINDQRAHIFRTICGQNNIGKADTIWRVSKATTAFGSARAARHELDRERQLQIILNYDATFRNAGRAVPLAPTEAALFVEYVGRGRVPIVEKGQVVGHRAAETGRIADF